MATAVCTALVLVLLAAAVLKARDRAASARSLATFGVHGGRAQRVVLHGLTAVEVCLACALAVNGSWAAPGAAALFAGFGVAAAVALLSGRAGLPCACFSGRSRLGWWTPARAALLALAAVALAQGWLPQAPSRYERLLTAALCVSIAASGALAVGVIALAREIGVLRLDLRARGALEIPDEGPELEVAPDWADLIATDGALLRLAVFSSAACPLCRQVAPAIAHVAADPLVSVRVFDEAADAQVWEQAGIPGGPYAVALDRAGVARAKGTFNSLAQLESVLASARAREGRAEGLALAA